MEEEALELITGKLGLMDRAVWLVAGAGGEEGEVQNKIMPEYRVKVLVS